MIKKIQAITNEDIEKYKKNDAPLSSLSSSSSSTTLWSKFFIHNNSEKRPDNLVKNLLADLQKTRSTVSLTDEDDFNTVLLTLLKAEDELKIFLEKDRIALKDYIFNTLIIPPPFYKGKNDMQLKLEQFKGNKKIQLDLFVTKGRYFKIDGSCVDRENQYNHFLGQFKEYFDFKYLPVKYKPIGWANRRYSAETFSPPDILIFEITSAQSDWLISRFQYEKKIQTIEPLGLYFSYKTIETDEAVNWLNEFVNGNFFSAKNIDANNPYQSEPLLAIFANATYNDIPLISIEMRSTLLQLANILEKFEQKNTIPLLKELRWEMKKIICSATKRNDIYALFRLSLKIAEYSQAILDMPNSQINDNSMKLCFIFIAKYLDKALKIHLVTNNSSWLQTCIEDEKTFNIITIGCSDLSDQRLHTILDGKDGLLYFWKIGLLKKIRAIKAEAIEAEAIDILNADASSRRAPPRHLFFQNFFNKVSELLVQYFYTNNIYSLISIKQLLETDDLKEILKSKTLQHFDQMRLDEQDMQTIDLFLDHLKKEFALYWVNKILSKTESNKIIFMDLFFKKNTDKIKEWLSENIIKVTPANPDEEKRIKNFLDTFGMGEVADVRSDFNTLKIKK